MAVSGQLLIMIMTVMMRAYCGLRCAGATGMSSPRLALTVSENKKYFVFHLVEVKYETNFEWQATKNTSAADVVIFVTGFSRSARLSFVQ
jgi:hypothetical protein